MTTHSRPRLIAAAAAMIAAGCFTTPVLAQDEQSSSEAKAAGGLGTPLGEQGQIAVSSDMVVNLTYTMTKVERGVTKPDALVTVLLAPAADYFIASRISVGGMVQLAYQSQGDVSAYGYGAAPRVGMVFPLSDRLWFWPKASLGYQAITTKKPAPATTSTGMDGLGPGNSELTEKKAQVGLYAPLLYQPADHFFLGLGPVLTMDIYSKMGSINGYKQTTLGLVSVVGGYF